MGTRALAALGGETGSAQARCRTNQSRAAYDTGDELNRHIGTLAEQVRTRDLATGEFIPVERQAFARAFGGERVIEDVVVRHRGTGDDRIVRCAAAPVVVDGRVVAAVAVNTDVTDLRRSVAERERLLVALDRERARLAEVFHQAPVAVGVLRGSTAQELVFETANPRYLELLPPGRDGVVGRRLVDVIPESAPAVLGPLQRVLDTGEPFVASEFPHLLDRDGDGTPETCYFNFVYHPLADADGRIGGIVGVGTEVTEQVRAREHVEATRAEAEQARADAEAVAARTAGLQSATAALAAATSFEDIARAIHRTAAAALGTAGALVYRLGQADLGEDSETLYGAMIDATAGFGRDVVNAWRVVPLGENAAVAEVVRTGEPVFHATREERARKYPHLIGQSMSTRFGSWAMLPLTVEGRPVGSLTLAWAAPQPGGRFTEPDRALAAALAGQCAVSVERVRLYAAERMAREQAEAARAALGESEARFRFALGVAELGAWQLDLATGEAWREPRHDQIFGYDPPRSEWSFEIFLAHVVPDDRAWVNATFGEALRTNTPWDFSCRIRRADGAERWIGARGEPVGGEGGAPARMVGVVRDVTAAREAESALRAARDEAEAANRAKSDFLAVMSHELRTPLNAIGGYTELVELGIHGPVTEAQRAALHRIQHSQRHLLGLINEVLNYARLESGAVRYDLEEVRVREALAAAETLVAPQVRARQHALVMADCPADVAVRADSDKLRQILVNLISNAVKFTDAGGRIELGCAVRDDRVLLWVRDTGIGIPADKLQAIFEPFVQVRADLTRTAEGTGLGLAISRDLARGMGGDLTAESTPGAGSTFALTLPRA